MATVRILRSTTPGAVPASLVSGQIAINEADGRLYYRAPNGTVVQVGGGSVPDPYELGTYPLVTISAQPSAAAVNVGESATFSVTATATLPTATIAYQWQVSTDSGSTWSSVSGATSSSYTLSAQAGDANKRFRCRLAANLSVISSDAATLTVNTGPPVTLSTPYGAVTGSGTVGSKWAWQSGSGFSMGNSSKLLTANSAVTLQATLSNTGGANCDYGESRSLGIYSAANARIRTMSTDPESLTAGQYIVMELACAHARAEVWVV